MLKDFLILDNSEKDAKSNMAFDEKLILDFEKGFYEKHKRFFRIYKWPQKSITYSYKQQMLEAVSFIDNSRRITGGGYVFHSEGDIVFSCVGSLSDLYFPKKMKEKMGWVSDLVAELLVKNGVKVQIESKAFSMANIDFCASYYNPYELYVDGYKICGITIRKLKKSFIIQGVLHVFSNINSFEQLTGGFLPFLTQGLRYKSIVDGDVFYNNLLDSLK